MKTCTRRLEFDFGHRLLNHESKCAHIHGHRGIIEVTCAAEALDVAGRVIDFSALKELVGGWIDVRLDHSFIVNPLDVAMLDFLEENAQRHFVMPKQLSEPSAENIAKLVYDVASELVRPRGIIVERVRFYETPNGWADSEGE